MIKERLQDRFVNEYKPCVKAFFDGLVSSGLSNEELGAVPSLFLPGWGDAYETSLFKIAIAGKETLQWATENGDSLLHDMKAYQEGRFDPVLSCRGFQKDGPAKWRNPFWQYAAAVLGKLFDADRDSVLEKESAVLRSIGWFNCHAIETLQSAGVDKRYISTEKMSQIQRIADQSGVSDFERFVRVFCPDVILYFYRNGSEDPLRNFPDCKLCKTWGEGEAIHEYSIEDTLILQMRHTSWMTRGNMSQEACADIVYEVLKQHGSLTFLQQNAGAMFDVYDMKATTWRLFVNFIRKEAASRMEMDNLALSRHLMVVMARELCKISARMTARTLVAILNEVERFRQSNWRYSEERRGPCSSVRGAYNAYADTQDADLIARAFTKLDGAYAYQ